MVHRQNSTDRSTYSFHDSWDSGSIDSVPKMFGKEWLYVPSGYRTIPSQPLMPYPARCNWSRAILTSPRLKMGSQGLMDLAMISADRGPHRAERSSVIGEHLEQCVVRISRRQVSVDVLDHHERGVPEDLCQRQGVHAARQRPGRERMPQQVRMHSLPDAGRGRDRVEELADA